MNFHSNFHSTLSSLEVTHHKMFSPIHDYARASHYPNFMQDLSAMIFQQKSCHQLKLRKPEVALEGQRAPGP